MAPRLAAAMQQPPLLLPVLLALLLLVPGAVRCQMTQPFRGQGVAPDEPVDVHVSALMERLLDVDDRAYRFEAVIYVYLSWIDPRAMNEVIQSTLAFRNGTKEECAMPCASTTPLTRRAEG